MGRQTDVTFLLVGCLETLTCSRQNKDSLSILNNGLAVSEVICLKKLFISQVLNKSPHTSREAVSYKLAYEPFFVMQRLLPWNTTNLRFGLVIHQLRLIAQLRNQTMKPHWGNTHPHHKHSEAMVCDIHGGAVPDKSGITAFVFPLVGVKFLCLHLLTATPSRENVSIRPIIYLLHTHETNSFDGQLSHH